MRRASGRANIGIGSAARKKACVVFGDGLNMSTAARSLPRLRSQRKFRTSASSHR
jgi:hypothetical protein